MSRDDSSAVDAHAGEKRIGGLEKAEADAVLERDTGPIELYLEALAIERDLPEYAVGMCTLRLGEAGPVLRGVLEKAAAGEALSEDEARLLFRGVYILGGGRDRQSFQPFLRLLRRPVDELDALLGDAMFDGLPQIIAGMFDGDTDSLLAGVVDRSRSERARASMLGAATFLAWCGEVDRKRFKQFLVALTEQPRADDEDEVWIAWVMAIGLIGLRDLSPIVKAVWADGRIPQGFMEWRHFEQDLRDAERAPDDVGRFRAVGLGYVEDVLEALDWARTGESADVGALADERRPGRGYVPRMPMINPNRDVGRNDPCPCGSGKKFKKCCLGA